MKPTTNKEVAKPFARTISILLADDDQADCLLFKEILEELLVSPIVSIIHNDEQQIEELNKKTTKLPDVLFLDLNMPGKNDFASSGEIKRNTELQNLTVIVISTSSDVKTVKNVFRDDAYNNICKLVDFSQLKNTIYEALTFVMQKNNPHPHEEIFMITGDSIIIPQKK